MNLTLPHDLAAEIVVVTCSVATVHGYSLAAQLLSPDDFYHPAHRVLFDACSLIPAGLSSDERIEEAALYADVPHAELARAMHDRPVMFGWARWRPPMAPGAHMNMPGWWIHRVRQTACLRRQIGDLDLIRDRLLEWT